MASIRRLPRPVNRAILALVALVVVASVRGAGAQSPQALEALHRRLLPVFELAGVVFTDADEASGRLVVGVLDRGAERLIRTRIASAGVPSQIVDIVETEAIVPVATLRDMVRPVVAGLQIRLTRYLCSLGFNASRAGVAGFVTAAHCSSRQGETDGTQYFQPLNKVADEFIGTEIADPPFFRDAAGCPLGRRCRYSDSNFVQGDAGTIFTLGSIAETTGPNNGSLEIVGEFFIAGQGPATVGMTANKVGRTTGWTQGVVSRTCAHTGVSGSNIVLLCQDFVESTRQIVAGGDSGSPVFTITRRSNVTLLGNLWGGNSSGTVFVYSPIANIERELGALTTF